MKKIRIFSFCLVGLLVSLVGKMAYAHEIRPAYLEIKQNSENEYHVLWKIPLLGNRVPRICLYSKI